MSENEIKDLKKRLLSENKNVYSYLDEKSEAEMMDFAKGYAYFLDKCKTEREAVIVLMKRTVQNIILVKMADFLYKRIGLVIKLSFTAKLKDTKLLMVIWKTIPISRKLLTPWVVRLYSPLKQTNMKISMYI